MKNNLIVAILIIGTCFIACGPSEQIVDVPAYTIKQFIENTRVFGGSFSHDNKHILISSDESGIINVYSIEIASGVSKQLTHSGGSSVYGISYFPDDNRFLYQMDNNGDEIFHLFVQMEDGTSRELTPEPGARAVFYGWSDDRNSFYYGYSKRNNRLMDIYEMDVDNFEEKLIYQNDDAYNFGGISPDKKYMSLSKTITTNDADLFLYEFSTGNLTKINKKQSGNNAVFFSKDSRELYYLTDDESEFNYLKKYNIESGLSDKIMDKDWDIMYAELSHGGNYMIVGINEDGKTTAEITDMRTGELISFPDFDGKSVTSPFFSDDESMMRFYISSSALPSDLLIMNMESGVHKQLTHNLNNEITPSHLVEGVVVRYPAFDKLDIPAIYYKPHQASTSNKVPALVWVHGGPGGQSRLTYSPLIQYLVNHGYAVLAVNNRGSSGYGKTFFQMDDQRHGEEDLKDCIWGKKWLQELEYIDGDKIGIIGGSYGGFMVMRALTHTPEEFQVGVNIFGVTNWLRTLRSTPPWWESMKVALYKEMGDPEQDSVRLYNISPVFHGDKVVRPVMVLQGAQDPRVLQIESDEMVEAVRANNVPVEYVVFEDEGHGFVKRDNQIKGYGQILKFLNTYLKGDGVMKD
jgi:dipeptidyl aminopeptidase/acylaminoacyl peptidase